MFVKFCGFTREEDIRFAAQLGIDAVGFVFYKKSKRYITPEKAAGLRAVIPEKIYCFGIFVETPAEEIEEIACKVPLDYVQLYDHSLYNEVQQVKPVALTYRIEREEDIATIKKPEGNNLILLDSFHPAEKGGTGERFNWDYLQDYPYLKRTIIAGGLNSKTVPQLLETITPYGLDISSGIETEPGIKSQEKMHTLMHIIKEAI
jgi:phosphoribosylanthranilate isomerase